MKKKFLYPFLYLSFGIFCLGALSAASPASEPGIAPATPGIASDTQPKLTPADLAKDKVKSPTVDSSVKTEVMELAQKIIQSAQTKNWAEYCRLLTPHSRYNLILNIVKGSKYCEEALQRKKSLAQQIYQQGKLSAIDKIVPVTDLVVGVDVRLPDDSVRGFTALKYQGVWGGDLHSPRSLKEVRRVMAKLVPGGKVNPQVNLKKDTKTKSQTKSGCTPSFLVKPLRREISVELNRQIVSPAANKAGL